MKYEPVADLKAVKHSLRHGVVFRHHVEEFESSRRTVEHQLDPTLVHVFSILDRWLRPQDEWKQRHDELLLRLRAHERASERLASELTELKAELAEVRATPSLLEKVLGPLMDGEADLPEFTEAHSEYFSALD